MAWQHTLRLLQALDRACQIFESDRTRPAASNLMKAALAAKSHDLISDFELTGMMQKVAHYLDPPTKDHPVFLDDLLQNKIA